MTGLIDGAMSVAEAAELLHVTEKQVQHLGRQGALTYLARGLVDAGSVRALHVARQGQHTRSWSSRTAWAAVALLSQRDAEWLGQAPASRLRSRLRDIDSPRLVSATRSRAEVTRFAGHEAVARRLDREAGTWARRALPQLVAPRHAGHTDWYVDARRMDHLVERYGLLPDIRGQYTFPPGRDRRRRDIRPRRRPGAIRRLDRAGRCVGRGPTGTGSRDPPPGRRVGGVPPRWLSSVGSTGHPSSSSPRWLAAPMAQRRGDSRGIALQPVDRGRRADDPAAHRAPRTGRRQGDQRRRHRAAHRDFARRAR